MSDPTIPTSVPARASVVAGKLYSWCRCGLSKKQPFCDGSEQGTGFEPVIWRADASKEVDLCRCKGTSTPPYCDGSHKTRP